MKVLASVQSAFTHQKELAPILIDELKKLFDNRDPKWFFAIRDKEDESFALKSESGRVTDLNAMEDFVACMLVVPMHADIADAMAFIERFFVLEYRRPASDTRTDKRSSDFPFDDLRLYGRLRTPTDLPEAPIYEVTFEVQVKTYLQHAWSIATHDLVYKYDRVSWARNRVAYQIKALLEHAELSISSIAELEDVGLLAAYGYPENEQQGVLDLVELNWSAEELPVDRKRLATNIWTLLNNCEIPIDELEGLLDEGKALYAGEHPHSLSPFQCVMEYLSLFRATALKTLLDGSSSVAGNYAIPVTDEVLDRIELDRTDAVRALK